MGLAARLVLNGHLLSTSAQPMSLPHRAQRAQSVLLARTAPLATARVLIWEALRGS